jgi:hypothetical protein
MIAKKPDITNLNAARKTFLAGIRITIPFRRSRKARKLNQP